MKNEIIEKLELFLQNLRCEDAGRETLVHLARIIHGSINSHKIRRSYHYNHS